MGFIRQPYDSHPDTHGTCRMTHEIGPHATVVVMRHDGVIYIYCLFSYIYIHTTAPMGVTPSVG
jgi:hypothetical protein